MHPLANHSSMLGIDYTSILGEFVRTERIFYSSILMGTKCRLIDRILNSVWKVFNQTLCSTFIYYLVVAHSYNIKLSGLKAVRSVGRSVGGRSLELVCTYTGTTANVEVFHADMS